MRPTASAAFTVGNCTVKKRYSSDVSSAPTASKNEKREVALDQVQIFHEVREPEGDDPRIEAHADSPERLGPDALDQRRANRHTNRDAGDDVGDQAEAFHRVQTGPCGTRPP